MADRCRRISRSGLNTVEDCPEVTKDAKAMHLVEHEEMLLAATVGSDVVHPEAGHEDGQSSNLFTAILNRWLMSNTFYASSVNSLRYSQ